MGRRKVEIKLIENKSNRYVTFSKRRGGLLKKARQLSVLCDASVAIVIFSGSGKLYEFSSGDSLNQILERYRHQVEEAAAVPADASAAAGCSSFRSCVELLDITQNEVEEPKMDNLSVAELVEIEEQLETALSVTRAKRIQLMMDFIGTLQEREKSLKEENELLAREFAVLSRTGKETNHAVLPPLK